MLRARARAENRGALYTLVTAVMNQLHLAAVSSDIAAADVAVNYRDDEALRPFFVPTIVPPGLHLSIPFGVVAAGRRTEGVRLAFIEGVTLLVAQAGTQRRSVLGV
jgi:hypothetical protein